MLLTYNQSVSEHSSVLQNTDKLGSWAHKRGRLFRIRWFYNLIGGKLFKLRAAY